MRRIQLPDGRIIEVEDAFASLSRAEQDAFIRHVMSQPAKPQPQQIKPVPPSMGTRFDAAGSGTFLGHQDEAAGLAAALGENLANIGRTFAMPFTGMSTEGMQQTNFGDTYKGVRDAARERMATYTQAAPGESMGYEMLGGLLTGGAGVAKTGALKGGQAVKNALGLGVAQGGTYGAGVSEEETLGGVLRDAVAPGLLGGAVGVGTPAAFRFLGRVGDTLIPDAAQQKAVDVIQRAAGRLSTGKASANRGLHATESTLRDIPFIGSPIDRQIVRERMGFQRKLMQMAGFDADDIPRGLIDDASINNASRKFSQRYTEKLGNKKVNLADKAFVDDIGSITSEINSAFEILPKEQKAYGELLRHFIEQAKKQPISGKSYKAMRSRLGKQAANNQDPTTAYVYKRMQTALDDAFKRKVPGGTSAIDKQYARYMQVRDTYIKSGAAETSEGLIPLPGLSSRSKDKGAGLADEKWRELINSASSVLTDKVANSATAQRDAIVKALRGAGGLMGLGILGAGTGAATGQDLRSTGLGLLGGLVGGRALSQQLAKGRGLGLLRAPQSIAKAAHVPLMAAGNRPTGLLANPLIYPHLIYEN